MLQLSLILMWMLQKMAFMADSGNTSVPNLEAGSSFFPYSSGREAIKQMELAQHTLFFSVQCQLGGSALCFRVLCTFCSFSTGLKPACSGAVWAHSFCMALSCPGRHWMSESSLAVFPVCEALPAGDRKCCALLCSAAFVLNNSNTAACLFLAEE